jgi:hypothetical protein
MKRILEVQKQIGSLSKNAKNPFFKSQYLDLNTLLNEVKPLLEAQGLLLMQPIQGSSVVSIIYDAGTGERLVDSHMNIPENITDPQKVGSAITYYRRYTLKSLLAIAEEDDDGNRAAKPTKSKLTAEGLDYLLSDKGTPEQINKALKDRDVTTEQITKLKAALK